MTTRMEMVMKMLATASATQMVFLLKHTFWANCKTRRQYELCIDKMTAWIRIHNPEGYDNSLKQMILPLSEKIIMEFLASVSIHKKKVSAGGAPSTVSISTVNSPRDVVQQMLS